MTHAAAFDSSISISLASSSLMSDTRALLVELLTEELPPKALQKLSQAFAETIYTKLAQQGLLAIDCEMEIFSTPRRLALRLSNVYSQGLAQPQVERLMPVKIGLNESGQASVALQKKLAAKGLEGTQVNQLDRESDGKQEYLILRHITKGTVLSQGLQLALDTAIAHLPVPKFMHYQLSDGSTKRFVRPAHNLVALFGENILPISALGLSSVGFTWGHRFLSKAVIELTHPTLYEQRLKEAGYVIASFETRRREIKHQLSEYAQRLNSSLGEPAQVDALIDEVTALVEWPVVYVGEFNRDFLKVPAECLILTMRLNQKYFPLFTQETHQLTHRFLIVSNMSVDNPRMIIEGNQRVVHARLADARFFYDTDRKIPLAARVVQLDPIIYHQKLGSQGDRVKRLRTLTRYLAERLGIDSCLPERAAFLAKADLLTQLVGEFPELQGIMGAYYAEAEGEPQAVVQALRTQYQPRFTLPVTSETLPAVILFIAERVETLIGIWSTGMIPTGERDPYGLRRAALGIIHAFEQLLAGGGLCLKDNGPFTLMELLQQTAITFSTSESNRSSINPIVLEEVHTFVYERYRHQLNTIFDRAEVDAVLTLTPPLHQIIARIRAITLFRREPAAVSLAAANKRIGNLLRKAESSISTMDPTLLVEPAEHALANTLEQIKPQAQAKLDQADFAGYLNLLAQAREPIDIFFNEVMVMTENLALRHNRLALLGTLHDLMNQVADISKLV